MHITLTQEDLYKLAFQEVRRRGFGTAGIEAFNNSRQIADDVITFRIQITEERGVDKKTPDQNGEVKP